MSYEPPEKQLKEKISSKRKVIQGVSLEQVEAIRVLTENFKLTWVQVSHLDKYNQEPISSLTKEVV